MDAAPRRACPGAPGVPQPWLAPGGLPARARRRAARWAAPQARWRRRTPSGVLTTCSWEQSDTMVKVYVPLRGVQTDMLRATFTPNSVEVMSRRAVPLPIDSLETLKWALSCLPGHLLLTLHPKLPCLVKGPITPKGCAEAACWTLICKVGLELHILPPQATDTLFLVAGEGV